jgi:RNA-directed DNA polymerase
MWDWSVRVEIRSTLGDAFLAGDWVEAGLLERAGAVLEGEPPRWLRPLVRRLCAAYRERPADRRREVHAWLDLELERIARRSRPPGVARVLFAEAAMGRTPWPVPPIATRAELAAFLDLHLGELDWLADARSWERTAAAEALRNYRYVTIARPAGLPRLLESPKRHLKELQRRVLHQILDLVPPHPDAQGFRRGHSALTHARRHVRQEVVVGFDLEDFFASVPASRVYGVFRGAGYPEEVAYRLTALCTNVVSREAWARVPVPEEPRLVGPHHRLGRRLATPHLPQGAPTSPALANLSAFGLDRRLSALAAATGAVYSRYADDLTFSGGKRLLARAPAFRGLVGRIVEEEGFRLNERKSRLTTRAGRQLVTGVVVNERPNAARAEHDRLKAILHDAARHGPDRANRAGVPHFRAHLLGRIAWIEALNPARGTRLRARFAEIAWDSP